MPRRLQRQRTAGWRKPHNSVIVSRPSRYGNSYKVGDDGTVDEVIAKYRDALLAGELRVSVEDVRRDLAGKDLLCYCAEGSPCHGDVLIEIANQG